MTLAWAGSAEPKAIRVATFAPELTRKGPGLLLRDILKGDDPQIVAVRDVILDTHPDVLLLTGIDYDHGGAAMNALADYIGEAGLSYPHRFALRPNTGMPTGLDMDGNNRLGDARDSQGFGQFSGQGGMAVLSRFPIDETGVQDFSALLWRDLPGRHLPGTAAKPFPSAEAINAQRLSSTGHWVVPVSLPMGGTLSLMAFSATPPVFDGPEDRNGLRNADEIRLWRVFLDGALVQSPPDARFVLLGNANLDPNAGQGRHEVMRALLLDRRFQDPQPVSTGAALAGSNVSPHAGRATADWSEPPEGPGNLRVDYVLPSADWVVDAAGVHWPAPEPGQTGAGSVERASRHRLVWVDLIAGE